MAGPRKPRRNDRRVIIHFDYDCFYASVFEHENPALKSLPLAVQQKQLVVTCNYEARRRGMRKMETIAEARRKVPDMVLMLGEELGRFRDASKELCKYLEAFTWSGKVEKLGFDEVFMDVTDIVDYNQNLLNPNDLPHSFFCLDRNDPTVGFAFDATTVAGQTYPPELASLPSSATNPPGDPLTTRLVLGSHFAQHLRLGLEQEKGYTSTVGISTNKALCKLVGNVHKPKAQTTLLPPYDITPDSDTDLDSNVTRFVDSHDIGKIPWIGHKMAQQIRNHVLSRPVDHGMGQLWGGTSDTVTVRDVRLFPGMSPELLEQILGGPGAERGIGGKAWGLINGVDDVEVQKAKRIPTQISIEDSYGRLDTMPQLLKELRVLATSLINRMHTDLLEDDDETGPNTRWIANPRTLRLSTRPRPPANEDGPRTRSFNRISRSAPLPNFIFNLQTPVDAIADKLLHETLVPMFKRLHPHPGWNLALLNIGVTNMVEAASDAGVGRDIGKMFRRQEDVLREWKVATEIEEPPAAGRDNPAEPSAGRDAEDYPEAGGSEDALPPTQDSVEEWEEMEEREVCGVCGAVMPGFAMDAHERFHSLDGE